MVMNIAYSAIPFGSDSVARHFERVEVRDWSDTTLYDPWETKIMATVEYTPAELELDSTSAENSK